MKAKRIKMSVSAVSAGVLAFALSASAAMRILPTPPPSGFVDTEASTNTFFAPLQEDTRQYVVRFAGDFSPSNDLEVAIGGDADGDGDLSPVEVEAQFGIDCGEKKVKVLGEGGPEVKVRGEGEQWNWSTDSAGQPEQEGDILCSPSPSTFTYSSPSPSTFTYSSPSPSTYTLKLTTAVSQRWNLIKVTRRGFFSSEPSVTLRPRKPGMMIIVR